MHSRERAELLGNVSGAWLGSMIRPRRDGSCALRADVRDEHAGGRRSDAGEVVVLGVPDAAVAEVLGALREGHARRQAVGSGQARAIGARSRIESAVVIHRPGTGSARRESSRCGGGPRRCSCPFG